MVGVAGVAALTEVLRAPGASGTEVLVVVWEPGRTAGSGLLMLGFLLSAKDLCVKTLV